jgi:APA family basic amino acid/polyamine antiporter
LEKKYSLAVGIALVIANMVGTGVFTSLGYQVGPLPSGFAILSLWLVGGVVALSGALTYAEVATTLKRSGGEYLYLGTVMHPALGFVAGWVSMLVGFAGAISAVALAIGEYSHVILPFDSTITAVLSIALVSAIHWFGVRTGGIAQTILTTLKISLILFFCIAPFFVSSVSLSGISFWPQPGDGALMASAGFAVSLVYVVYAYTGWNAAAYIAGNLENPVRNLPRSLITGTCVVVVIYLLLNAMFLYTARFDELAGQNDIGNVVAYKLFGPTAGALFSALFSIALLSTLSAMTIAGPRVFEAMGEDYPAMKWFAAKNRYHMPFLAIATQAGWAIFLVLVSSFKEIIQYISISLSIFSMLTVLSIFWVRQRYPAAARPFTVPLYPLPPIVFTVCTGWMIYYVTSDDPRIILYSLATMIPGLLVYFAVRPKNQPTSPP